MVDATMVKHVADAHAVVTKLAWDGVLQYENLHKDTCSKPTLMRFHGNPDYTIKARFWQALGYGSRDGHTGWGWNDVITSSAVVCMAGNFVI